MPTGTRTTYTDTNIAKRGIADLIKMIDWTEAPLLQLLGLNNESRFNLAHWPRTKVEWIEDSMSPRSGTINEALDNSETGVDVQSGEGAYLKEGDVIKINDELMLVASVATDTATVTRGYAGSTATTHDDDDAWEIVTVARVEGDDFTTGHTTTLTLPFNYTQILSEAVQVTGSQEVNQQYGISDEMARQVAKLIGGADGIGTKGKAGKLAILLEKTFYHGGREEGSATVPRSMGGFDTYVTTNVYDKSGAALQRAHIHTALRDCVNAGGSPDCLIVGAWGMEKVSQLYDGIIRTTRDETIGGHEIEKIRTPFGELAVIWDRWCPNDSAYVIEKDRMGWMEYRPFDVYDRASTGDYKVKDVLGEYTFCLCNEESHAKIHNFSTTK